MPAEPETVHAMPAVPVSSDKMATAPESTPDDTALLIVATAILSVWAAHTSAPAREPSAKMAASSTFASSVGTMLHLHLHPSPAVGQMVSTPIQGLSYDSHMVIVQAAITP
ncbi:unnamed protein product [Leuciscus chuanchicus]